MTTCHPILAAFGLGGPELLLILLIVLLLFGGAKLPSLARGLGQSIKEFKKASREDEAAAEAKPGEAKPGEAKKSDSGEKPGAN